MSLCSHTENITATTLLNIGVSIGPGLIELTRQERAKDRTAAFVAL
jgi:hypothetical protein